MCPITGTPAPTMACTRESIVPAPSILTASAPASLTKRIAFVTASSSDTWKEPNGMSATMSGPACPARHRARQHQHLLHRRRDRRVVTQHRHRGGVAHEDHVCARRVREPAGRGVVRGDHRDRRAALLHPEEIGDRQLAGGGGAVARRAGTCAHEASSRGTLSIRRVEPTRTAAARTGGSNGAIST